MYAIVATYRSATGTHGSRFTVRAGDRARATIPYDHAAQDAGRAAILRALELPAFGPWHGTRLSFGTLPDGSTVAVITDALPMITYAVAEDPDYMRAHAAVGLGRAAEARVIGPDGYVLFHAWRVSETSYAWKTSAMSAPAFLPYGQGPL